MCVSSCSDEGITIKTPAMHQTSRAKKPAISTFVDQNPFTAFSIANTEKKDFFKISLPVFQAY